MARLDDLRALREGIVGRMESCESDQNYAVLGRLLADVVKQIDEIDPAPAAQKGTALDELNARRAARVAGSTGRTGS